MKQKINIIVLSISFIILILFSNGCEISELKKRNYEERKPTLWKCGEEIQLFHDPGISIDPTARVCTDKTTGVKYLYIWGGLLDGGPAVTRYYDK